MVETNLLVGLRLYGFSQDSLPPMMTSTSNGGRMRPWVVAESFHEIVGLSYFPQVDGRICA